MCGARLLGWMACCMFVNSISFSTGAKGILSWLLTDLKNKVQRLQLIFFLDITVLFHKSGLVCSYLMRSLIASTCSNSAHDFWIMFTVYFAQFWPTGNGLTQRDVDLFAELDTCSRDDGWELKRRLSAMENVQPHYLYNRTLHVLWNLLIVLSETSRNAWIRGGRWLMAEKWTYLHSFLEDNF